MPTIKTLSLHVAGRAASPNDLVAVGQGVTGDFADIAVCADNKDLHSAASIIGAHSTVSRRW